MKKIISLITLIALLCSLISCGEKNREYDENEVKLAAEALIRKSADLNRIFWGEGKQSKKHLCRIHLQIPNQIPYLKKKQKRLPQNQRINPKKQKYWQE